MRMPTKARQLSIKTILAGLGIALLSACSGNATGPTAPAQPTRAKTMNMGTRNDLSGYVVAERDSLGNIINGLTVQVKPKLPDVDALLGGNQ